LRLPFEDETILIEPVSRALIYFSGNGRIDMFTKQSNSKGDKMRSREANNTVLVGYGSMQHTHQSVI
jgi:hypothetical protein